MRIAALAVLLSACGAAPICEADGLTLVRADLPVSCGAFASNVAIARHILGQRHIDSRKYMPMFDGVTVTVLNVDLWWSSFFGQEVGGEYWAPTRSITLSRDGHHLLHEMFHHMDSATGVHGTANHPEWGPRGMLDSAANFERSRLPLDAAGG